MTDLDEALAALPDAIAEDERLRERVDLNRGLIELTAKEVGAQPYLVWNAFIALLVTLPYESMSNIQRAAHVTFSYDAEVQNGGHYQFFVNQADGPPHDVPAVLDDLSLHEHAKLFRAAHARWQSLPRPLPTSREDFVDDALEAEFEDIDSAYHELSPTILDMLESLLERRQAVFVRVR